MAKELPGRDKAIYYTFSIIGIVCGIILRRMSGLQGALPGAAFGAMGAVVGGLIGRGIIALLPSSGAADE